MSADTCGRCLELLELLTNTPGLSASFEQRLAHEWKYADAERHLAEHRAEPCCPHPEKAHLTTPHPFVGGVWGCMTCWEQAGNPIMGPYVHEYRDQPAEPCRKPEPLRCPDHGAPDVGNGKHYECACRIPAQRARERSDG